MAAFAPTMSMIRPTAAVSAAAGRTDATGAGIGAPRSLAALTAGHFAASSRRQPIRSLCGISKGAMDSVEVDNFAACGAWTSLEALSMSPQLLSSPFASQAATTSPYNSTGTSSGLGIARRLEPAGDLFADDDDDEASDASAVMEFSSSARFSGLFGSGGSSSCAGNSAASASEECFQPLMVSPLKVLRPPTAPASAPRSPPPSSIPAEAAQWTTMMLRNIPFEHDEESVARTLDALGFVRGYDVIYVPRNRKKGINLGYAFVNFSCPRLAAECLMQCNGRVFGPFASERLCKVQYSNEQGAALLRQRVGESLVQKQAVVRSSSQQQTAALAPKRSNKTSAAQKGGRGSKPALF